MNVHSAALRALRALWRREAVAAIVVAAAIVTATTTGRVAPDSHGHAHASGNFSHTDTCEALSLVNG